MTFMEWRKFNFFDLKKGVDDGKLSNLFKETEIAVTTSGNNNLVIGDSLGNIHLISRSWQITTFRAYELRILLVQQLRNSPFLVTIGEDEAGINPLIKVWDINRLDKNGSPYCSRISRALPNNKPVQVNTLCVHENMQLMAVGFTDGSLVLYRGDITRERGSRQKNLRESSFPVTGLAFKSSANATLLFVATETSVYIYNITHKDKEQMSRLDNKGCIKNCSILAESVQENNFMVGRDDAIYCYTTDGRGPCYAVDGEKVMLRWFRSYLIIVSKSTRVTPNQNPSMNPTTTNGHLLTVLDIQNKFIVFSTVLEHIKAILNEWGGFYIIDIENNICHLNEKDLQSKLSLLFKKNLYDVAIRIAKSQQYDSDGLVDIFRQYGDHLLYGKGDHNGAIDQYVKTIGKLEPSYVIRKFLDSKHIEKLTSYLQALHKQGQATEDHTTLLLNCFTKLNKTDSLKEFILQKDRDLDFDVDIAIKVCRQASPEEAIMLAKKHAKHDWYIKLQLEDNQKYADIIDYISNLDFDNAQTYMKKYGHLLIQNAPSESTQFLKILCTDYKTRNTNAIIEESEKADPEDYIHLFLNNSARLVEFLEYLLSEGCVLGCAVYDTLLEHYLYVWESLEVGADKSKCAQKTLKLLQNPDTQYDKPQALVVCHMHGFAEGVLYLYGEQKLYQQILRYHMSRRDISSVLTCCRRYGHSEPNLWVQALWGCIRDTEIFSIELLPEILNVIAKKRLLSPQLVIEAIGTGKANITLAHIRTYIINELKKEGDIAQSDADLTNKYRQDTESLKNKLESLKNGPILIQGSRCAACHHTLELPSLHFMCQHSYHQHCFQSYSESEHECPACQPENKKLLELLKAREYNKDLHETFHSQLEKVSDGFSLAAEYFGRGVFNTVKVIKNEGMPRRDKGVDYGGLQDEKVGVVAARIESRVVARGDVKPRESEGRIRQYENKRSGASIIPISEGRVRLQEHHKYSSSLEANIIVPKSVDSSKSIKKNESTTVPDSTNPFEEDSTNPFDEDDTKNLSEDDDYDKNLNPFSS